jgi:hypothetical protein
VGRKGEISKNMIIENINKVLLMNDIMVRINTSWYRLEEVGPIGHKRFPIAVSNKDGKEFEFDMADVDEFDPILETFNNMDEHMMGVA